MLYINIVITFLLFKCVFSSLVVENALVAQTNYGLLAGKQMTSRSGLVFSAFLGIPYAEPPIGKLRFLPPARLEPWEGIRNATTESNICLQRGSGGSEDCLYLNVFTHSIHNSTLNPVMVYFHGGGFYLGSSSMRFLGPEYFMDRDVILVTTQYRLGPFGFLSTEDEIVPGNMGLKDQTKALQWVQENIKYFGGDPKKVTIFGNSAGGASVHLHMQSPLSRGLFTQGISQSGTALSGFAMIGKGRARNATEHMALSLNCSTYSTTDMVSCLQNKSALEILAEFNKQLSSRYDLNKILFRPIVEVYTEHAFITENPRKIKTNYPWLVGVNANEGIFRITLKKLNETLNQVQTQFDDLGPQLMFIEDLFKTPGRAANDAYKFYFQNVSSTNDFIKALEQVITDSWFAWPTEEALLNHNNSIYHYLYNHQNEHSYAEFYGAPKGFGVSHVDELISLFSHKSVFPELNEQDINISKLMVNFWVNFATTGNPTPEPVKQNPQRNDSADFIWDVTNGTDPTFINIQTNSLTMEKDLFHDRMEFWLNLTLKYLKE